MPAGCLNMPDSLQALLHEELSRLATEQLLRERRVIRPIDAVHVEIDGRRCVNFCSNNYLGLTHHPRVVEAVRAAATEFGAGSGAAGLISGFSPKHLAAEAAVAQWKSTESALLLPSGYQANLAAVQTLAGLGKSRAKGVRFLIDKLAHASLLDAVRGSDTDWRVFPHNGIAKIKRLLSDADPQQLQVVVTESVFSMDGDSAELAQIARLKQEHPFVLLLDEAHASGVYGPNGAGLAAEMGLQKIVDVFIVTFSKSAGCMGAAICGSNDFCRAVANFGRAYIFSTEISPPIAAGIETAIAVMRDEPQRQRRVRELAKNLRVKLREKGWDVAGGDSPIIPLILGAEAEALRVSGELLQKGLLVLAVRPPTVPKGTSRLRITLSCEHSQGEIEKLADSLAR